MFSLSEEKKPTRPTIIVDGDESEKGRRRRIREAADDDELEIVCEIEEVDEEVKAGDPLYALMYCWLTAVSTGLLKSEEILEGASRRISNDVEFEEQKFIGLMNEARERRAKLNATTLSIPMEIRAEKALEAIYVCCFGREPKEEEDERLLNTILGAVFLSVKQTKIVRIVKDKAKKVAEGTNENSLPELKSLPKEATEMQMKDLQFLQQNRED